MPLYAARCGPAPAHTRLTPGLRLPACLASSSCGRHEYSRCLRQTSSDVRHHHCLMPLRRGRGNNKHLISLHCMNCTRSATILTSAIAFQPGLVKPRLNRFFLRFYHKKLDTKFRPTSTTKTSNEPSPLSKDSAIV